MCFCSFDFIIFDRSHVDLLNIFQSSEINMSCRHSSWLKLFWIYAILLLCHWKSLVSEPTFEFVALSIILKSLNWQIYSLWYIQYKLAVYLVVSVFLLHRNRFNILICRKWLMIQLSYLRHLLQLIILTLLKILSASNFRTFVLVLNI